MGARSSTINAAETPSAREPSGTSLLRRFTLVSLATTGVVGALVGMIAAHGVEEYAYRERAHTMALYVSEFLAPRLTPQDFLVPPGGRRAAIGRALHALVGRAGIRAVTVWNAKGDVLYADDYGRLGPSAAATTTYLRAAMQGRVVWRRPTDGKPASRPMTDLEVFIPVLASDTGPATAVYAVVAQVSDLQRAVIQLRRGVWLGVAFGLLVLYTTQFYVVHQAAADLERQQSALHGSLIGTVRSLARAVDARDLATGNHSSRVAKYAGDLAQALRLRGKEIQDAQMAGYLHDLGKIGVPDAILTKEGPLSQEERIAIQQHSIAGYEILRPVPIPERVKLAVRHNHECWDGSGYPDGLAGDQIPLLARIVAVADTYEALTTARRYREAWEPQTAVEEIRRCSESQFDPCVVKALLSVWRCWVESTDPPGESSNGMVVPQDMQLVAK